MVTERAIINGLILLACFFRAVRHLPIFGRDYLPLFCLAGHVFARCRVFLS